MTGVQTCALPIFHTDSGHVGIGETDTNPWVAKAMIEAPGTHIMGLGLRETLIGKDPRDVEGLWEKLYIGSAMTGTDSSTVSAASTTRCFIAFSKSR